MVDDTRSMRSPGWVDSMFGRTPPKSRFCEAWDHFRDTCTGLYNRFKGLFTCFNWVWGCVQTWTPLSATFLIYWLVYRPDRFHPHIASARLSAFHLTNASDLTSALLRYDLAVDLSFQNSHRLAMRYLDVAASLFYNDTRLGPTDDVLPGFVQEPKTTTVLRPEFSGEVTVDSGVAAELQREQAERVLHLRVTVSLALVYKVLFIDDVFFYKYDCWLWFQPPNNNRSPLFDSDGTMCRRV